MRAGVRIATFALAGILLAPVLVVRATRLARELVAAGKALWTDDFEQRRLDGYGYCDRRGYGYVRRVLRKFPEADALPRIHYGDTERYAGLLLPEDRPRLDPRVFIGITLDWRDTRERMWPAAADTARAGAWKIRTSNIDIDLLTGLRVSLAGTADAARTLELTLFETPNRARVLGRWTLVVPAGAREGVVRLDAPLERFSIKRGAIDFALEVAGAASVSSVDLAVVPIDGRGLVVVQEEGGCLTAVTADLLREIERGPGPWAEWMADLRRSP